MKILHVIPSLDPAHGGPPKIAARLAAAQAGLGHDVRMTRWAEPNVQELVERELSVIPSSDGVRHRIVPRPRLALPIGGAPHDLHQAIAECDFLHLHALWDPITKFAADTASLMNKPYTILLNGMLDPWTLEQKKWKKRLALWMGYRRMLDNAAFLHTGNADEVRLIGPLGLRTPCRIIPNGVFLEEISPLPPSGTFYSRHPELNGEPFVLFMARLHYKKGLDYLAAIWASVALRVAGARLVVAGPDGGAKGEFESRIKAAGDAVSRRVHIIGPIYDSDRLAAMADAACFCLPSRQEGFSLAITEALGCGLPVVISENCHFPEVAEAGAGFVLPLEPPRFADAIVALLNDPDLRQRMSRAGAELVRERYTWPAIAAQTIRAYEQFLPHSAAVASPS